jgi:hypothetical protein
MVLEVLKVQKVTRVQLVAKDRMVIRVHLVRVVELDHKVLLGLEDHLVQKELVDR